MRLVHRVMCLFTPLRLLVFILITSRDGQAELTWLFIQLTRWCDRSSNPRAVTHPSTNRARRAANTLMETIALPLRHQPKIK